MTTEPDRDEILHELRELAAVTRLFYLSHEVRALGTKDWDDFLRSSQRAHDFLLEVDGPKVEVACCCTVLTPWESLSGRTKCPLHHSQERTPDAR